VTKPWEVRFRTVYRKTRREPTEATVIEATAKRPEPRVAAASTITADR
jgi:hypothetical protein